MNASQNNLLSMINGNYGFVRITRFDSNGECSHEIVDLSQNPTNREQKPVVINPIVYDNFISTEQPEEEDNQINEMEHEHNEMMNLLEEEEEIIREKENQEIDEIIEILKEEDKLKQERENQEEMDAMIELLKEEERLEKEKQLKNVVECAICIEKINITNNCVTPCGHNFCLTCILISYSMYKTCPLCRSNLIPEIDTRDHEEDTGHHEEIRQEEDEDTESEIDYTESQYDDDIEESQYPPGWAREQYDRQW